jgi:hypothetical protein
MWFLSLVWPLLGPLALDIGSKVHGVFLAYIIVLLG